MQVDHPPPDYKCCFSLFIYQGMEGDRFVNDYSSFPLIGKEEYCFYGGRNYSKKKWWTI